VAATKLIATVRAASMRGPATSIVNKNKKQSAEINGGRTMRI